MNPTAPSPEALRLIRIGHSPDPDDAFMFYGMTQGKIPMPGFRVEHLLADIETLNRRAAVGDLEVTAFSLHAYPACAKHYKILTSGASMGDGYGPVVVARKPMTLEKLQANRGQSPSGLPAGRQGTVPKIAIPGAMTTPALVLNLWAGKVHTVEIPFDQIMEAVNSGKVDAGVVIHEGQLTYSGLGLQKIIDLGVWWRDTTGLPLPLGVNGVNRNLPETIQRDIARLMRESIAFGLKNRPEALAYAQEYGRGLDRARTDKFVGMYVSSWTQDCGEKGKQAMKLLLQRAYEGGWILNPCVPEFAEG
ncbi:MAG: ABC transporter substrate-binding protein [Candidatus Omnitrophica bacterium]|nr:ABC transporter substrate-binding protein [Candidatus Omnitrophota bacterium]